MELGIRWLRLSYAILIVLLVHINACFSIEYSHANVTARCPERERDALLAIKGDMIDEYNLLSSWGISEYCCRWERVHCDHHTGHVVQLHLNGLDDPLWKHLQGNISPKIIELKYLEHLDLSFNEFNATQIPPIICSLSNLRHLDLRYNNLNGSKILELIGNLSNLRYLDLYRNYLEGGIPASIGSLSNLRHLDLGWNDLRGSRTLEVVGNMTRLRYLDLSYAFSHDVSVLYNPLKNLTHLQHLSLADFYFFTRNGGNLNWLPHLSSLKYLDIFGNDLSKATDWLETINKLPNLRNLTLIGCDLPPPILSDHINSSHSPLVSVDLYDNRVTSSLFKWLSNYNTTLADLDLSYNQLSGSIPDVFANMRSLAHLDLFSNQLSGSIPDVFANMRSLMTLELSFNQLSGSIPDSFSNLSSLAYLDLSWNQLSGSIPNVFINMNSLISLDLSFNQFTGLTPNAFTYMSSLENLDLSYNPFEEEILTSIAQLCMHNLTNLYVSSCNLTGHLSESVQKWSTCSQKLLLDLDLANNSLSGPFPDFTNFPSLKRLDLSNNKLSGRIPDSIGNLSALEELRVDENQLRWTIPESIGRLLSLQYLSLSGNLLSGKIPESVGQLFSLSSLHLSRNQLSGSIPQCIMNLSSLEDLMLQENLLSGRIPGWIGELSNLLYLDLSRNWLKERVPKSIGQLSSLNHLNLSTNHLEGEITETHFSKLHNLYSLDFSSNSLLEFNVTTNWIPPFQLEYMSLRSCKVGPKFPGWLRNQDLQVLDMSYTEISDVIPSWFWGIFRNGSNVDLSNNQIGGRLVGSSQPLSSSGFELRLSSNRLEGPIPSFLSYSSYLDLSDNKFSSMTSFLCSSDVKITKFLDLSNNHISGEVPDCWRKWGSLELLDLSFNVFSGKIPPSVGYLVGMKTLKFRSNKLIGEVPSSLKNHTSLNVMDLGNNQLSGSVPQWLGVSLPNLVILMLQFNQLSGSLPPQLCQLAHLQILDVSMNQISGSIPKCLQNMTSLTQDGNSNLTIRHSFNISEDENMTSLYYDDDEIFNWKGAQSSYKSTLGLVKRLDLSSNKLSGEVPTEITHLVGLISLNLSRNNLAGQIPLDIGNLKSLDSLDLSRNEIHGEIPMSLTHVDRLSYMDLSYNNLSGKIPTGTQLQGYSASSYVGNPLLCGLPLKVCNAEENGGSKISRGDEDADALITQGFYISLGLGFAVGFWGICGSLIFKRSWRYAYYNFLNRMNDWLFVKATLIRRKIQRYV